MARRKSATHAVETEVGGLHRVHVQTKDGVYPVLVGLGARFDLPAVMPARARIAAIVTQPSIGVSVDLGLQQVVVDIPDGEKAKSFATIEMLCRRFAQAGLTRNDVIVGVGGGVVTDVAGFAASIFHRGVAFVNVATTLLAQVDAAIGGKTGVNLPEGKNLAGTFWQPSAVICDTEVLESLPEAEMRSGRGEIAKYAFIGAPGLEKLPLAEQIARCVALKASIVGEDEKELSGRRAVLNYGHTLGHALEAESLSSSIGRPSIRHGEAVAVGLAFAARLAHRLGRIEEWRVAEHYEVLEAYGLDPSLPPVSPEKLISFMAGDKKSMFADDRQGLTFVLDGPKGVELVTGVARDDVVATLSDMRGQ